MVKTTQVRKDEELMKLLDRLKASGYFDTVKEPINEPKQETKTPKDLFKPQQEQPKTEPQTFKGLFKPEGFTEEPEKNRFVPDREIKLPPKEDTVLTTDSPEVQAQKPTQTINDYNETNIYENANLPDYIKKQLEILNNPNSTAEAIRRANLALGQYNVSRMEAGAGLSFQREAELKAQAEQLGSQVGQFQEGSVNPTGFDYERGIITGLRDAVPSAISFAGSGAGLALMRGGALTGGLAGSAGGPIGAVGGAAIGAGVGLVAGLVRSISSDFSAQRRETISAQKRILDEAKPTMTALIALAGSDPSRAAWAVGEYNKQLAMVAGAYQQMKLDTSRDVLKFESATEDLAEFEAFYTGEMGQMNEEMRLALGSSLQQDPDYSYRLVQALIERGVTQ